MSKKIGKTEIKKQMERIDFHFVFQNLQNNHIKLTEFIKHGNIEAEAKDIIDTWKSFKENYNKLKNFTKKVFDRIYDFKLKSFKSQMEVALAFYFSSDVLSKIQETISESGAICKYLPGSTIEVFDESKLKDKMKSLFTLLTKLGYSGRESCNIVLGFNKYTDTYHLFKYIVKEDYLDNIKVSEAIDKITITVKADLADLGLTGDTAF